MSPIAKALQWIATQLGQLSHRMAVATSEDDGGRVTSSSRLIAITLAACAALMTWLAVAYVAYTTVHGVVPSADVLYGIAAIVSALLGGSGVAMWKRGVSDGPPPGAERTNMEPM